MLARFVLESNIYIYRISFLWSIFFVPTELHVCGFFFRFAGNSRSLEWPGRACVLCLQLSQEPFVFWICKSHWLMVDISCLCSWFTSPTSACERRWSNLKLALGCSLIRTSRELQSKGKKGPAGLPASVDAPAISKCTCFSFWQCNPARRRQFLEVTHPCSHFANKQTWGVGCHNKRFQCQLSHTQL